MRAHLPVAWTLLLITAIVWCASPASAQIDALCTASVTINFDPSARLVLPPTPAPYATSTGGGTITGCVVFDQGPTTGTFTYSLEGNLTCTSTENVFGTVNIAWADNTESFAEITTFLLDFGSIGGAAGLTAIIISGRFAGDQIQIANVRDPLASIRCVLTGLSQAQGTTILTFTQPL